MKQKRLYEEARIDVVQLSSKAQLLAESSDSTDPSVNPSLTMVKYQSMAGGFSE